MGQRMKSSEPEQRFGAQSQFIERPPVSDQINTNFEQLNVRNSVQITNPKPVQTFNQEIYQPPQHAHSQVVEFSNQ